MKLTNKKTGQPYEVSKEAGEKIRAGKFGKRFHFHEPAPAPPELTEIAVTKEKKPRDRKKKDEVKESPETTE